MARFNLKEPCRHCPFRSDETGIRFASRERAQEIEESAYRHGFPCHMSAVNIEDEESPTGEGGLIFGEKTQYCAGHIIFQCLADSGAVWPGIDNDDALLERLERQVNLDAPVFESHEALFAASEETRESQGDERCRRARERCTTSTRKHGAKASSKRWRR